MGCCQSTAHVDEHDDPVHGTHNHDQEGSQSPVLARRDLNLPSPRIPASPRQHSSTSRIRRRSRSEHSTPLQEHFNKPVVPHVWDGKHKYTLSLPGPNARRTVWTRRSLDYEREVFFDTQTTAAPEVWGTLRMAGEMLRAGDIATAQSIVDAAEVTVPYGDIVAGVFDRQGQFYQMPEWAVADPPEIIETQDGGDRSEQDDDEKNSDDSEERREAKGKNVLRPSNSFDVTARLSDRGGPGADITVNIGNDENVRTLSRRVREEAGLLPKQNLRIAYLGKLLKENESLKTQGWKDGHMVNALVSG